MSEKFMGVGLKQALSLALFTILVIVALKVIVNKKPIPGVSDVVNAV
jgi:hypothetical protein